VTGVSYGIGIHAIAKDQYPRYRGPNGGEAFDKGLILGKYQSGTGQKKDGSSKARAVVVHNVTVSRRRGRGRRAWWSRVVVGSVGSFHHHIYPMGICGEYPMGI
jgi:hypothetical protein